MIRARLEKDADLDSIKPIKIYSVATGIVHLVVPRANLLVALVGADTQVREFTNAADLVRVAKEQYGSAPIVILYSGGELFNDLITLGYLGVSKIYL